MIYAISARDTTFVKFGKANNPTRRLNQLQTSCPYELRIIACADWPSVEEPIIHIYLDDFRIRGEWFERSPTVERVIGLLRDGENGYTDWLRIRKSHNSNGNASGVIRRLGRALQWRTT